MGSIDTEDLVKKIKSLPAMNTVVQKLLQVTKNDNTSATEVTDILSSDQAIASKVLALVNSSFYGFPSKITTISRAVVILGNKSVQNLALSFAAMDIFKDYKGCIPIQQFWSHALAVATISQQIAKHKKFGNAEELFIVGLLHDLGQLVLSLFYPEQYNLMADINKAEFIQKEKDVLGTGHEDAGALLLEHWQIPNILINAVKQHHSTENIQDMGIIHILRIAEYLSAYIGRGSIEEITEIEVAKSLEALGLDMNSLSQILKASYVKTIASENSFDIKSDQPEIMYSGEDKKTILVVEKSHFRREALSMAISAIGYSVHTVKPKDILSSSKLDFHGVVFDSDSVKPDMRNGICDFIQSKSTPTLILNADESIQLKTPHKFAECPFQLGEINSLLNGE